jgi:phosphocarrier protein
VKFQKVVTIQNKLGLHARAAALFVQTASKFKSKVKVKKFREKDFVNGKSILGVLMLALPKGGRLTISVEGPDANDAIHKLVELVNDKFGEEN